jgi:quercetin dioxygenase-like cupin family protein
MENGKVAPIAVGANDGQTISVVGGNYRILVSGLQTGGDFATIEMLIPPGGGPVPHAHAHFHETFFVAEGEVEVKSEAGTYIAEKGAYVVIPKGGIIHKFKNKTDKVVTLLCTVVPAGLEEMFMAMGKPTDAGTFLPPPPIDAEGIKRMTAMAAEYGQTLYPPDFLG